MAVTTLQPGRLALSPLVIALGGAVTLSAAMGIGRFAFTPLLPMMMHQGLIDIGGGSLLATANYAGYLAGALICMVLPSILRRLGTRSADGTIVRAGLAATVLLTLAMALDLPAAWPAFRFLSGVISAFVFVHMSTLCLRRLAERNALHLSGLIYTGPGIGITLSGLLASGIAAGGGSAVSAWIAFGLLAAVLSALVWPLYQTEPAVAVATSPAGSRTPAAAAASHWQLEAWLLALAYGLAGFGYIVTATFLPVIAREALGESAWIDFFWPIFGIGVAVGATLTRFVPARLDRRALLIACYLVQAVGVVATLAFPTVAGFLLGSACVGLPFTVITLYGMQEARRLRPVDPTAFIALMTATYGIGQIAGPPVAAAILAGSPSHGAGFSISLSVAAAALVSGALIYFVMLMRYPPKK